MKHKPLNQKEKELIKTLTKRAKIRSDITKSAANLGLVGEQKYHYVLYRQQVKGVLDNTPK